MTYTFIVIVNEKMYMDVASNDGFIIYVMPLFNCVGCIVPNGSMISE